MSISISTNNLNQSPVAGSVSGGGSGSDNGNGGSNPCATFLTANVLPNAVIILAGNVNITPKACTTTVQSTTSLLLLGSQTFTIAPLGPTDKGNVVITSALGITLTTFVGVIGVAASVLALPGSTVNLTWNGTSWVQVV